MRSRLLRGIPAKLAELVTVFVGVYAAFLLNSYQVHRQERQRREQILAWLDKVYSESAVQIRTETDTLRSRAEEFQRQVDAGARPRLTPLDINTDYDPADLAGLLQGGGFDLLEVKTIHGLRDVEGTFRLIVSLCRHDEQLSDSLVLPYADLDQAMFYDPVTKKLLRKYAWYGDFFVKLGQLFEQWQRQTNELLVQIRAERARNR